MLPYAEICVGDDVIKIEIDTTPKQGEVEAVRPREIAEHAQDAFDQAMHAAQASAEKFIQMVKNLSQKPSKVEIEFGLKLDAEVGAMVAKASTDAHYKVTLSWEPSKVNGSKS